ncbi:hypothetical protein SAMN05192554_12416 [Haloarchaeobius iranensis]|uniref:Uncharacterized protein n=1 Tax=Haloarchaeobius iranensis TaxID=996166 RepID=A0A1H0A457_9EURY|nr:hypothetical protein SAMN05192554_12416 [Haloarchaeobius iranensis]
MDRVCQDVKRATVPSKKLQWSQRLWPFTQSL